VQIGKQLQQRPPRACGPVISAVAPAPPGSVSTPTEKHFDGRDPSDHDGLIDIMIVRGVDLVLEGLVSQWTLVAGEGLFCDAGMWLGHSSTRLISSAIAVVQLFVYALF